MLPVPAAMGDGGSHADGDGAGHTVRGDQGKWPDRNVQLAGQALWHDLDGSESFVTLFCSKLKGSRGR